jgi:hypothetical protein
MASFARFCSLLTTAPHRWAGVASLVGFSPLLVAAERSAWLPKLALFRRIIPGLYGVDGHFGSWLRFTILVNPEWASG